MYNDDKHRFPHLSIAICSTGKSKVRWQKSATLAVNSCQMTLQELFGKGTKQRSLPLICFLCHPSVCISSNVLIPILKNRFMPCYFSSLLTLSCSGYLLHNDFGDRNWWVLSLLKLFRSTLPYLLRYLFRHPSPMKHKGGILPHFGFWVLHEENESYM